MRGYRYICLFVAVLAIACHKPTIGIEQMELGNGILATYNIPYGQLNANKLDIFHRSDMTIKKPVLIHIFGGGWVSGDKNMWQMNHINFFDNLGFISVAVNYTLSSDSHPVRHPLMVDDVAQSISWVSQNISGYGGDSSQIYLMGGSAGALLVALIGTDEQILGRVGLTLKHIKGVIALDGGAYMTLDPIEYILPEEGTPYYEPLKDLKHTYQSVFGYTLAENRDACPYYFIESDKGIPPFLLISQGEEIIYRHRPNKLLDEKLKQHNIESTHHIAQGYEHTEIFQAIGTKRDSVNIGHTISQFLLNLSQYGK